jgi:predicted transposase YdaD
MDDIISSILIYKFTNLSRDEVAAMIASSIQESRAYREIKAEGVTLGKQELVLLLLGRKLKTELSEEWVAQIQRLSIVQLDNLAEALLDFESIADLTTWLTSTNTPE